MSLLRAASAGAAGSLRATAGQGRGGGAGGGAGAAGGRGQGGGRAGFTPAPVPEEFARRQGNVTAQTMAQIKQFVEEGGSVIAIGGVAMAYAQQFNIPSQITLQRTARPSAATSSSRQAACSRWPWIPTTRSRTGWAARWTCSSTTTPCLPPEPAPVATCAPSHGLRARRRCEAAGPGARSTSTRAIGIVESSVGKGRVFIFGPEILFRAQPHGTFKFFFNSLYLSSASGWPGK